MTTKTLTGTYAFGYTLSPSYSGVSVTSTGKITGINPAAYDASGGNALIADNYVSANNAGLILGGRGATGARSSGKSAGGQGGAGGIALDLLGGGDVVNINEIYGGFGGTGGEAFGGGRGGAGGGGIYAADSSRIDNAYYTEGGGGGFGGEGTYGGVGGAGAFGVNLAAGGYLLNESLLAGGAGGGGGAGDGGGANSAGGVGGDGGAGVTMAAAGTVENLGYIVGGAAGLGGAYNGVQAKAGYGGIAVALTKGGTVINSGRIAGGSVTGGVGGYGGDGVSLGGAGYVSNSQTIMGGGAGYGGTGGAGIVFEGIGTLVNSGLIEGGEATGKNGLYRHAGAGVILAAGGSIDNTGTIEATDVEINGMLYGPNADGVDMNGGQLTNGPSGFIIGYLGVADANGTITNYGTIEGLSGFGLRLESASSRLISEPGSFVPFAAYGSNGTLELAPAAGTISGLGIFGTITGPEDVVFEHFGSYVLDKGGSWTLSGANSLATGQHLRVKGSLTIIASLEGAGVISGGGVLVNSATGTVDATGAMTIDIASVTNDGLIEQTGSASLTLLKSKVDQTGGGTIEALASKIFLADADIVGGTLACSGGGVFVVDRSGGILDGSGGHAVTINGDFRINNKTGLTIVGAIDNQLVIDLDGGANSTELFIGAGGATLSGPGEINLTNKTTNHIESLVTATLTNVANTISGSGVIGDADLTLDNQPKGIIESGGSAGLIVRTGANTILNAGTIKALAGGGLTVGSALDNTGLLVADGGTLTLEGAVSGTGKAQIDGGALDANSTFTQNVDFTGSTGVLELAEATTYTGRVTGLSKSGTSSLDLGDIDFISGKTTATFVANAAHTAGVLTVTDGTHTARITLEGDYAGSKFTTKSDGHGGTTVVDPMARTPAATHLFIHASAGFEPRAGPAPSPAERWRVTVQPALAAPRLAPIA